MGVYRPTYTRPDGTRAKARSWYIRYADAAGKVVRRKVGPDRRLAEAALVQAREQVARERAGLAPAASSAPPLADLAEEYLSVLAARGRSHAHRVKVRRHLAAVLDRWASWRAVTADSLVIFLGARRADGNGPATLNGYLRSIKGFSRWCSTRLGTPDPLAGVKPFNEAVDRRRSQRILTADELARLIAAADTCPYRRTPLPGPTRAKLYLVAAYTGLRASELASLTPGSFDLSSSPPTVTVEAKDSKGRRVEPVPLPGHLVPVVREWLAAMPPGKPLFPGKWASSFRAARVLRRDARRAGIPERDARGQWLTFHGIRSYFCTALIASGATFDEVRRLARHRSLSTTMTYYAKMDLGRLGVAADRLPPVQ